MRVKHKRIGNMLCMLWLGATAGACSDTVQNVSQQVQVGGSGSAIASKVEEAAILAVLREHLRAISAKDLTLFLNTLTPQSPLRELALQAEPAHELQEDVRVLQRVNDEAQVFTVELVAGSKRQREYHFTKLEGKWKVVSSSDKGAF